MHETHRIRGWKLKKLCCVANQGRSEDIWNDKRKNVPSYYYTVFNVLIYVAVVPMENFQLRRMRLVEVGTPWWLLGGPDATGCEGVWPQSRSHSVPLAEQSCLCCATTYFQGVTGTQSSVRLRLSLSLSLWSEEHPNPFTEQKGDLVLAVAVFSNARLSRGGTAG